jgi:hypothetical protein
MRVISRTAVTVAALAVMTTIAPAWTSAASAGALATVNVPQELSSGRALLVRASSIEVVRSGTVIRSVAFTGSLDLSRLPDLVGDQEWGSSGWVRC